MRGKKSILKVNNLFLIPELLNREFDNPRLKSVSKEIIDNLTETKELRYLSNLLSIRSIYEEKTLWKQIDHWKVAECFYRGTNDKSALKDIEEIQSTVLEALCKRIKSNKLTTNAKPPKHDMFNIDNYVKLQSQLQKNIQELEKNDVNIELREKNLKLFLTKNKILGKDLKLTDKQIRDLSNKRITDIAKYLIARLLCVSVVSIKRKIAELSEFEEYLNFRLANGKQRNISWNTYDEKCIEAEDEIRKKGLEFSENNFAEILSQKLDVPKEEIINLFNEGYNLVLQKPRTPHKKRNKKK